MRSSTKINSDFIAVGISFVIVATFSILLYADFTRKIDVGDALKIGNISFKRKVAQRKYASQVIWEDLDQNVPVYNNDSIRTSDLSEAVITLEDGTSINLDENSMILLAMLGDGINIDFSHGSISAKRGEKSAEGGKESEGDVSKINIQSKGMSVSFGKGDVKLSKNKNKELNLIVSKGIANVKAGDEAQTVGQDQRLVLTRNLKTKIFKINLKLLAPSANHFLVTNKAFSPINFSWEPVKGNNLVFLEVSQTRNFARTVVRRAVNANKSLENIPAGNYYWRLKAINKNNKNIEYSEIRKINIIRDQAIRLAYPPNGSSIYYSLRQPNVNIKWFRNKLASAYILEISKTPDFKNVLRTVRTSLTALIIDKLKMGRYFWRIRTSTAISGTGYSGVSPVFSFNIVKKAENKPPVLISPSNGTKVGSHMFGKKGFMFSWRADSQIRSYEVFIARDRNFKKLEMRVKNNGNFFNTEKKH